MIVRRLGHLCKLSKENAKVGKIFFIAASHKIRCSSLNCVYEKNENTI